MVDYKTYARITIIITGCDVCVCSYSKILTHFKPDFNTVNSEILARILFSRIALKDIVAT